MQKPSPFFVVIAKLPGQHAKVAGVFDTGDEAADFVEVDSSKNFNQTYVIEYHPGR